MKIETHFFRSGSSTPTEQLLEMTKSTIFIKMLVEYTQKKRTFLETIDSAILTMQNLSNTNKYFHIWVFIFLNFEFAETIKFLDAWHIPDKRPVLHFKID